MTQYIIKDMFDTLQGEGARAGARSVFVRFGGCNMWNGREEDRAIGKGTCARWCDTDFYGGMTYSITAMLNKMHRLWPRGAERWCVLTGGEPALQVDSVLVKALHDAGWFIAIETNGTVKLPNGIDWITVSPKLLADGSFPKLKQVKAHELKVVLPGAADETGGWTQAHLDHLATGFEWSRLFVQPQDPVGISVQLGQKERNVKQCIEFVKQNPWWRLSIQTHKILGLP